jgi:NADH:ubiquinone oxidoreductase subunit 6 (subunit J)
MVAVAVMSFYAHAVSTEMSMATEGSRVMGNIETVGTELYTRYLLPFEVASVLLLVAMIGAVVLARRQV